MNRYPLRTRRFLVVIGFTVALLSMVFRLSGANNLAETAQEIPPIPEFSRVAYNSCNEDEVRKLAWSVAYMRAAASSQGFRSCLRNAVEGGFGPGLLVIGRGRPLYTYQESFYVGPYLACQGTGKYREPSFVYQSNPFEFQNRLLAYEAALAVAQSRDNLELSCMTSLASTAAAPSDHGYFRLQHDSPYQFTNKVLLGFRIFSQFPDHQTEDYGESSRFGTISPAYQIDEISGILLHEILHNYGFEHGTAESNECRYREGYDQGRFHSLNEIAEACMSEVVEASIALCTKPCDDQNSVSIANNPQAVSSTRHPYVCQCTPYD